MNPNSAMTWPGDDEIRAALEQHAHRLDDGTWYFDRHPMNIYSEAQVLTLTKINLMLGTQPNGSLGTDMLEAIVDRIAHLEHAAEERE